MHIKHFKSKEKLYDHNKTKRKLEVEIIYSTVWVQNDPTVHEGVCGKSVTGSELAFPAPPDECVADPAAAAGNCQTKSAIPDRADPFPEKVWLCNRTLLSLSLAPHSYFRYTAMLSITDKWPGGQTHTDTWPALVFMGPSLHWAP